MKFKEQVANLTRKQKIEHFWEYYKIHTIVTIITLIIVVHTIYTISISTETLSHGLFINAGSSATSSALISDDYLEYASIDNSEFSIVVDTSLSLNLDSDNMSTMETSMKISTLVPAGEVDYIIAPKDIIEHYSANGFFISLEEFLPTELYETYSEQFLSYRFADDDSNPGEQPIAINISDSPKLAEWGVFANEDAYIAFVSNSGRPEAAIDFLEYINSTN